MARKTKFAIDVILNTRVSTHSDECLLRTEDAYFDSSAGLVAMYRISKGLISMNWISGLIMYVHSQRVVRRQLSQLTMRQLDVYERLRHHQPG